MIADPDSVHLVVGANGEEQDVILVLITALNKVEQDAKVMLHTAGPGPREFPFQLRTGQLWVEWILLEEFQDDLDIVLGRALIRPAQRTGLQRNLG